MKRKGRKSLVSTEERRMQAAIKQELEESKKLPFSGRIWKRRKEELLMLCDYFGTSQTFMLEQAIHEKALRDLPGLREEPVVKSPRIQDMTSEQSRVREGVLV